MNDEKAALRRLLRFRRKEFAAAAGPATLALHAIAMSRIALERIGRPSAIAAYLSNGREVDPMPMLELAWASGIATALPHIPARGAAMRFLVWNPGDPLRAGPYGVPQPLATASAVMPDVILTPLVAFDRSGRRLGQGGGFYDRAFADFPAARRIGLAWSVQQIAQVPVASWDQPLHAVLTEREWIDCA